MVKNLPAFALEGPDGCGKTTVAIEVARILRQAGLRVRQVRDPGTTGLGNATRDILLNSRTIKLCPKARAALFVATSAQLIHELSEDKDHDIFIMDRCYLSNLPYCMADGIPPGDLLAMATISEAVILPDNIFYLDVDNKTLDERMAGRITLDNMERRGPAYTHSVRSHYRACLKYATRVDGNRDASAIAEDVAALISAQLRLNNG